MIIELPHIAPEGYSYKAETFNKKFVAIWLIHHRKYTYNGGKDTRSIWGFYCVKTGKFHSPIDTKKVGSEVDISKTSPYSSMPILKPLTLNPLEAAFY